MGAFVSQRDSCFCSLPYVLSRHCTGPSSTQPLHLRNGLAVETHLTALKKKVRGNFMKKILVLVLALVLCLGVFVVPAYAAMSYQATSSMKLSGPYVRGTAKTIMHEPDLADSMEIWMCPQQKDSSTNAWSDCGSGVNLFESSVHSLTLEQSWEVPHGFNYRVKSIHITYIEGVCYIQTRYSGAVFLP